MSEKEAERSRNVLYVLSVLMFLPPMEIQGVDFDGARGQNDKLHSDAAQPVAYGLQKGVTHVRKDFQRFAPFLRKKP